MLPYLTECYGNAGSLHGPGREAASAIRSAREQAARLFGGKAEHIIFTSGGSESNSMVFHGVRDKLLKNGKNHLIISAIEHDSVLKAAKSLAKHGFCITFVQPDRNGCILPQTVQAAIRKNTGLVSVMFTNNETGITNDIQSISQICNSHSILFHTDCVQAAGQFPIEAEQNHIGFASVSSHKIHGPKGVGALYVRDLDTITPLIYGGAEQEFGLRGGTENVAGIVGFGKACELALQDMRENLIEVAVLKQRFYQELTRRMKNHGVDPDTVHVNGYPLPVIECGKTLSIRVDGVNAETLLLMLDTNGVCVSAGSACRSHEAEPSHVLTAMGLTDDEARSSVRFSFSRYNTADEVDGAAETTASCIALLKSYEPQQQ